MSRTIDERVVEMRFDNDQFERNVRTSMSTLDKLKAALKLDGASKGLNEISSKSINTSGLNSMSNSIQAIEKRFSTLGIVGAEVIRRLTDTAMDFTGNVMSKVYDGIVGGGLRRAQNIEDAHFKLQGLLKDEQKVQEVMAVAMDSVDGTAYGFDVAAKAASMFTSSGLKAGSTLDVAMKALAGTTAMTGDSYERISEIFTKVAGQGRIMGDDLNQFAARGLNVAATLADYYREVKGEVDMTEQGIRDLISDKKTNVYFEDFAKAMNWAFGDQAKKANETFNGSLDNIKAALSRVGAKFFTPLIEQNSKMVELFNTIRVRINDINKFVDPFANKVTKMVLNAGSALSNFLQQEKIQNDIVTQMPKIYRIFDNVVNTLVYTFRNLGMIVKPVGQGLQRFIPYDILDRVRYFTAHLSASVRTFRVTDSTARNLRDTFRGVSAVFDIFGRVLKNVFNFAKPLAPLFSSLASGFLSVTGTIGRALTDFNIGLKNGSSAFNNFWNNMKGFLPSFNDFISESQKSRALEALSKIIERVSSAFGKLRQSISKLFGKDSNAPEIQQFGKHLEFLKDIANGFQVNVVEGVVQALERLANLDFTLPEQFDNSTFSFNNLVDAVTSGCATIIGAVAGVGEKILERIIPSKNMVDKAWERFNTITGHLKSKNGDGNIIDEILKVVQGGSLVVATIAFANFVKDFSVIASGLSGVLSKIKATVMDFRKNMKAQIKINQFKAIATAVAILAGAALMIAQIPADRFNASMAALGGMMVGLGAFTVIVSKFSKKENMEAFAKASGTMIAMAAAIFILANALKAIGEIGDPKVMLSALASVVLLMLVFADVIKRITSMTTTALAPGNTSAIYVSAMALVEFAGAIWILSKAMQNMATIPIPKMILSAGIVAGLIYELQNALMKLSIVKPSSVIASGFAMIEMAAAIGILTIAISVLSDIKSDDLAKGVVAVGIAIAELSVALYALRGVGGKNMLAAGAAMMEIAFAMQMLMVPIITLGMVPWDVVNQGLVAVAAGLGAMALALGLLGKFGGGVNMLAAGGGLILVAMALNMLVAPLTALGLLPFPIVAQGLKAIGIALGIFVLAAIPASYCATGLIALGAAMLMVSGAVVVFGLGISAIGTGIATLSAGLLALSAIGEPAVKNILKAIESLAKGILEMVPKLAGSFVKACAALGVALCEAIVALAPALGEAALSVLLTMFAIIAAGVPAMIETGLIVIDSILSALTEYTPKIIDYGITWIEQILDGLASRAGDLTHSIANFLSSFIGAVINEIKKTDPSVLLDAIMIFGLVAGLMYAASGLAALLPEALIGVAAAGVVVAEIAVLLAAIGNLTRIPGLKEFMTEGGNILGLIGEAIGKFVGGLIGGVVEQFSSSLPAIGQNLSDFMTNASGFIDGAKKIDASVVNGVGYLTEAIIILSGGQVIDGILSFLNMGNDIDKFGEKIVKLGDYMGQYGEKVADIKPYSVEASAHAAEMIADLTLALSNSPELDSDKLSKFGEELQNFGPKIAQYSRQVSKVKPEAVEGSVAAAKMIADMAKTLPNEGGVAADWAGDNTLSMFAEELAAFGPKIVRYSRLVKNVKPESVEGSVRAAQMMADMATTIPNMGGLIADWIGDNRLSAFGDELMNFGPKIAGYARAAGMIETGAIEGSQAAVQMLVDMANSLERSGGLIETVIGSNSLSKFGKELENFAPHIVEYSNTIGNANLVGMNGAITEIQKLVKIVSELSGTKADVFKNLANGLKELAQVGIDKFIQQFQNAGTEAENAVNTLITNITNAMASSEPVIQTAGTNAGNKACEGVVSGLGQKTSDVVTASKKVCDALIKEFKNQLKLQIFKDIAAKNIMGGLIQGMQSMRTLLLQTARNICTELIAAFKNYLSSNEFKSIGENVIKSIADGIKAHMNEAKQIGIDICKGVAQGIKEGTNYISEAFSTALKQAYQAGKDAVKIKSPSKVARDEIGKFISLGVAEGILAYSNRISDASVKVSTSAVDSMKKAISKISDAISNDMDIVPTISPVLDLSNIQNGSKKMRGLLTKGLNTAPIYTGATAAISTPNASSMATSVNNSNISNNYNFTQNNYSPKALSRTEIYRQTKNQFSMLKGAVNGV